jgi:RimJ/RimL family protein N-acetyltransferase
VDPEARLDSDRIELEPLRPEHAAELFPLLDDARLHEYTGGKPATLDELTARYEFLRDRRSPDGAERWLNWIVRVRSSGEAVGTVQATIVGDNAFVAWVIGSEAQGQGYAGEAARSLVTALMEDPKIASVTALVAPGHIASERVAERAGLVLSNEVSEGERAWRVTR